MPQSKVLCRERTHPYVLRRASRRKASALNQLELALRLFERFASSTQGCVRSQLKSLFFYPTFKSITFD